MSRTVLVAVLAISLSGCASTQLSYNAVDVATSVVPVYTRQVLENLSKYIDEPEAVPSQMDLAAGTVQTTATVTPGATWPGTQAITKNGVGAVTSTTLAGVGFSVSASDAWQQNWNVAPISDANTLRNLRALYRYAVYGSNLKAEYHVPRTIDKSGNVVEDAYFTFQPHCVLCGHPQVINRRLQSGWLYWSGTDASGRSNPPPDDTAIVDLGHYGNHELFLRQKDFFKGYLADFTLFVLPNNEPSGGGGGGGGGGAGGAAAGGGGTRHNFNILVPQGIQQ